MSNYLKKLPQIIVSLLLFSVGVMQMHSGKMLFVGLLFRQPDIKPPANYFAAAAFFAFALCLLCLVSDRKHIQQVAKFLFISGFILIGVATFSNA